MDKSAKGIFVLCGMQQRSQKLGIPCHSNPIVTIILPLYNVDNMQRKDGDT